MELQYDQSLSKWVLQNPAKGISPASGVPVGTIEYFAAAESPAGYLKADGSEVGRETCPDLFRVIGTTYGEGDGETSFNLPDLINRFAQGSVMPGKKVEAGLPNIKGEFSGDGGVDATGAFAIGSNIGGLQYQQAINRKYITFNASRSNPIYGTSETVQPPALTLLPCIKAFDVTTNPGLIDITELANDVASLFRKVDNKLGLPSSRFTDLTLGASGNSYTAPADGWFSLFGIVSGLDYSVRMVNMVSGLSSALSRGNVSGAGAATSIPCTKGDSIHIYYDAFSSTLFRFVFSKE